MRYTLSLLLLLLTLSAFSQRRTQTDLLQVLQRLEVQSTQQFPVRVFNTTSQDTGIIVHTDATGLAAILQRTDLSGTGIVFDSQGSLRIQANDATIELDTAAWMKLPQRTTDPTGTAEGRVYYNTSEDCIKFYDGSSWDCVGSGATLQSATLDTENRELDITDSQGTVSASTRFLQYSISHRDSLLSNIFPLNSRVKIESTGAEYLIQSDTITGYATDSIAVIPTGSNYAIIQPESTGKYAIQHFGEINSDIYLPFKRSHDFISEGNTIIIPTGEYNSSQTWYIEKNINIEGQGRFLSAKAEVEFPADSTGLYFRHKIETPGLHSSQAKLSNIKIQGSLGSDSTAHGILVRSKISIEGVVVAGFRGDGIHINASSSSTGNANYFKIYDSSAQGCTNGLYINGSDANAGTIISCDFSKNRHWGIWDSSFLGNYYFGNHMATNGDSCRVVHNGVGYAAYNTPPVGNEPGVSPNWENYWGETNSWNSTRVGPLIMQWDSTTQFSQGGPYKFDSNNANSVMSSSYSERLQGVIFQETGNMTIGGSQANTFIGTGVYIKPASNLIVNRSVEVKNDQRSTSYQLNKDFGLLLTAVDAGSNVLRFDFDAIENDYVARVNNTNSAIITRYFTANSTGNRGGRSDAYPEGLLALDKGLVLGSPFSRDRDFRYLAFGERSSGENPVSGGDNVLGDIILNSTYQYNPNPGALDGWKTQQDGSFQYWHAISYENETWTMDSLTRFANYGDSLNMQLDSLGLTRGAAPYPVFAQDGTIAGEVSIPASDVELSGGGNVETKLGSKSDSSHSHTLSGDVTGDLSTTEIAPDAVTTTEIDDETIVNADVAPNTDIEFSKLQNGTFTSVLGRATNSPGPVAPISGADGEVLRVNGTTVEFAELGSDNVQSKTFEDYAHTRTYHYYDFSVDGGTLVLADTLRYATVNTKGNAMVVNLPDPADVFEASATSGTGYSNFIDVKIINAATVTFASPAVGTEFLDTATPTAQYTLSSDGSSVRFVATWDGTNYYWEIR